MRTALLTLLVDLLVDRLFVGQDTRLEPERNLTLCALYAVRPVHNVAANY